MKDPIEYRIALGQIIIERRTKFGFTCDKLARIAGIDANTIISVEKGDKDPELSEMLCIALALGIPLSTLLALTEAVFIE